MDWNATITAIEPENVMPARPVEGGVFRPAPSSVPPPTAEQLRVLMRAAETRRPIRAAASKARFSAVTTLIIGLLGLPFMVLSFSWSSMAITLGVCVIGAIEYVGYRRLRLGLPSAANFLACNQLAFLGLISAYCVFQMLTFSTAELDAAIGSQTPPEVSQLVGSLAPLVTVGFYSLVIVMSIVFQGGLAMYYFTRRKYLRAYEQDTPAWACQLLATLSS